MVDERGRPSMQRTLLRFGASVGVVAVLLLLHCGSAWAANTLETAITIQGKSSTDGQNWFLHTYAPTCSFDASGGVVNGFYYTLRRLPYLADPSAPASDPANLNSYAAVPYTEENQGLGANASPQSGNVDLRWWAAHQPGPYAISGMHDPVEGQWYIRARSVQTSETPHEGPVAEYFFFIDVTPPAGPIEGIVSPGAGLWTEYAHRDVLWSNRGYFGTPYDSLSGDDRWYVTLNGEPVATFLNVHGARYGYDYPYGYYTFENLRPGLNTIGVAAVDLAGNVGPITTYAAGVDTDTPKVSVSKPAASAWIAGTYPFTAYASDLAGISSVTFKIDGVTIKTAPGAGSGNYIASYNTKVLKYGAHTLIVEVRDMFGHVATTSRAFSVDNVPVGLGSISDSPDPFYPWIRDGYKDTTKFTWYSNKYAVSTWIQIAPSGGSVVRQAQINGLSAGWHSIHWDGRSNSGKLLLGTYYYRFVADDHAGNRTYSGWYTTTIRNYEIVRIGPNKVKIVPR